MTLVAADRRRCSTSRSRRSASWSPATGAGGATESDFAIPVLVRGTGRTSGIDVAWDLILVTRLRDGLVTHLLFTTSPQEARERLGGAAADPVSDAAEGAG